MLKLIIGIFLWIGLSVLLKQFGFPAWVNILLMAFLLFPAILLAKIVIGEMFK